MTKTNLILFLGILACGLLLQFIPIEAGLGDLIECVREYADCVSDAWDDYNDCVADGFWEEIQCAARLWLDLSICDIWFNDCTIGFPIP